MLNKQTIAIHLLLSTASKKKKIQNRALNAVVDSLIDNKENFDKDLPRTVAIRYGRVRDGKQET